MRENISEDKVIPLMNKIITIIRCYMQVPEALSSLARVNAIKHKNLSDFMLFLASNVEDYLILRVEDFINYYKCNASFSEKDFDKIIKAREDKDIKLHIRYVELIPTKYTSLNDLEGLLVISPNMKRTDQISEEIEAHIEKIFLSFQQQTCN